jgi:hypothetical protein
MTEGADQQRRRQQQQLTADTLIMQKVNAVNREAFVQRFPGQLEHAQRLVAERLQHCLSKPEGCDLAAPDTWPATTADLANLARALRDLTETRQLVP